MYLAERNLLPTDVKTETQLKELLKNFSKLLDTFLGHAAEVGKIKNQLKSLAIPRGCMPLYNRNSGPYFQNELFICLMPCKIHFDSVPELQSISEKSENQPFVMSQRALIAQPLPGW